MTKRLYMVVSDDELELPVIVTDTCAELAEWAGVGKDTIWTCIHKARLRKGRTRYVSVDVDFTKEELEAL